MLIFIPFHPSDFPQYGYTYTARPVEWERCHSAFQTHKFYSGGYLQHYTIDTPLGRSNIYFLQWKGVAGQRLTLSHYKVPLLWTWHSTYIWERLYVLKCWYIPVCTSMVWINTFVVWAGTGLTLTSNIAQIQYCIKTLKFHCLSTMDQVCDCFLANIWL